MSEPVEDAVITENSDGTEMYKGTVHETPKVDLPETWQSAMEKPEGYEPSAKVLEYKTEGELAKAYDSLNTMIEAKGIIPPAEGEDNAAFLAAVAPHMGDAAPMTAPEKYAIESIDASEVMSTERKDGIYADMKALGFDQKRADGAMELYGKQVQLDTAERTAAIAATTEATEVALKAEWGEGYADKKAASDRAIEKFGIKEKLEAAGLAGDHQIVAMMEAFSRTTAEDTPNISSDVTRADASEEYDTFMRDPTTRASFNLPRSHPTRIAALAKRDRLIVARSKLS
jgi:hypothetical protein